jgi:hypothetical protein
MMKRKSKLFGVLILLWVALGMAFPAFAEYTLSLLAKDGAGNTKTEFSRGEYLYLNINLSDAAGVAGCAFTLEWDTDVLIPPSTDSEGLPVNSGDITSAFPFTQNSTPTHRENSTEAGKIYFAGAEIDPADGGAKHPAGPINLFIVKFKVKENAAVGNVSFSLTQTELFNPAAGYGIDANTNGVFDEGDTKGKVPVLVGALANSDPNFGGDLSDDFPILLGDQTGALALLEANVQDMVFAGDSANVTNTYSPFQPNLELRYAGTGIYDGYGRYFKVMGTEVVDTVRCLKVMIKGHGNDTDPNDDTEWYYVWLAQDASGVVWALKYYGALSGTTTTLGRSGAVVWAPSAFAVGQRYGEEGSSYYEVVETGLTVSLGTGLGSYTDCVKVKWTDGVIVDYLYMAPDVGIVKEEWDDGGAPGGWELEEIVLGFDELAVDFGNSGLFLYSNNVLSKLSPDNPEGICALGKRIYVDFGGTGFWRYEGVTWSKLSESNAQAMMTNGSELYVDFGTVGLWKYTDSWTKLSPSDAAGMIGSDDGLYVDFGNLGLFHYSGDAWTRLSKSDPENLLFASGVLYADFGPVGFWKYDGAWLRLSRSDVEGMCAIGVDVFGDFGSIGLWKYSGGGWTRLSKSNPEKVYPAGTYLVVDFGPVGFWKYDGAWVKLSTSDAEEVCTAGDVLYVDFGGTGLWKYGADWTKLSPSNPEIMLMVGDDLYVDFGEIGLWKYDGSWQKVSPGNAEALYRVDLR